MEIAIVGDAQSGKSTLFEIMTGVRNAQQYREPILRGIAKIPDRRFDHLVDVFKPEKATPAAIPLLDINTASNQGFDGVRQELQGADGFIHVVDAFTSSDVDALIKRYRKLADDFILADLTVVERKMERLAKIPANKMRPDEGVQRDILPKLKERLESGDALREIDFKPNELNALSSFALLTLRPELIVINYTEGATDPSASFAASLGKSSTAIGICCKIEAEIASLPAEDRRAFLDDAGIEEAAFERILKTVFAQYGRIVYFTVGSDEVRAWIIRMGDKAPRAAAAIHKDFERGFIKAEVTSYDDFISNGDSLSAAKAAGKVRLEGKDYAVCDGDIISFRFSV